MLNETQTNHQTDSEENLENAFDGCPSLPVDHNPQMPQPEEVGFFSRVLNSPLAEYRMVPDGSQGTLNSNQQVKNAGVAFYSNHHQVVDSWSHGLRSFSSSIQGLAYIAAMNAWPWKLEGNNPGLAEGAFGGDPTGDM